MKIAITGTIGAGKSTVVNYLKQKGITVFNTDEMVHQYYDADGPLYSIIRDEFGPTILNEDLTINRKRLAEIVFKDDQKLKRLESIVHPRVAHDIEMLASGHEGDPVVFEVPLLFESNMAGSFDYILMVTADLETRLNRLVERGISREDANLRMKHHFDEETKKMNSNLVLYNNTTVEELKESLDLWIDEIRKETP